MLEDMPAFFGVITYVDAGFFQEAKIPIDGPFADLEFVGEMADAVSNP